MKSTIIIPTLNGMCYLENCLHSLKKERAHIIVVDNGSTDGSYEMVCEKFPQVEVIRFSENTGFCKAVNAGIRASSTKYVIFLNNDTVVCPGFVRELEAVMERDERIFSGSAKMLSMWEKEKIDDAGDLYCALGWAYAIGKGRPETAYRKSRFVFASCGGAAIYRAGILAQIGLLDENHFAYLEDIDLGYRAQIYGFRNVFVPRARVYHAGSASSGSRYNPFKVRLSAQNSLYLVYKNMPLCQILLNAPLLLAGIVIKALFFLKKGLAGDYLRGIVKGVRLCASPEGRAHKVPYVRAHFADYCRIQLQLWANVLRLFL
ncbi:MAG: glycosyltransferase family 2 protein [Blautia sp.]|nr:glycosyltransferase family 2 protein [Lachnoclostridium sp.]MCM1211027.1 glycosyltransferase family 2 protein [Blautia sp.]